jgi:hypothetical protein
LGHKQSFSDILAQCLLSPKTVAHILNFLHYGETRRSLFASINIGGNLSSIESAIIREPSPPPRSRIASVILDQPCLNELSDPGRTLNL